MSILVRTIIKASLVKVTPAVTQKTHHLLRCSCNNDNNNDMITIIIIVMIIMITIITITMIMMIKASLVKVTRARTQKTHHLLHCSYHVHPSNPRVVCALSKPILTGKIRRLYPTRDSTKFVRSNIKENLYIWLVLN